MLMNELQDVYAAALTCRPVRPFLQARLFPSPVGRRNLNHRFDQAVYLPLDSFRSNNLAHFSWRRSTPNLVSKLSADVDFVNMELSVTPQNSTLPSLL